MQNLKVLRFGGFAVPGGSRQEKKQMGAQLCASWVRHFRAGFRFFRDAGVNLAGLSTDLLNHYFSAHLMHFERYSDNKLPVRNSTLPEIQTPSATTGQPPHLSHISQRRKTMAQFNVDSEVIAAKSAQARSYVASITADVNGMTASLHDLQSSWTGSASANFQGVLDQWHATQRQVEASITQINEALTRAGVNYADTEQANASMFVG